MAISKRARSELQPTSDYSQTKQRVTDSEDPRRRFIIEQLLKPVGHKRAGVGFFACSLTKGHFQGGQWTNKPQPRLGHHERDRREMGGPEPWISNPVPTATPAKKEQEQADNYERHEGGVRKENDVSK